MVAWTDDVDDVLAGDLTAVAGYTTPAGGTVVTPVAPLGLRNRERGSVTFTTSLGFGRKLERIRRDPRVALSYHAREHGFSTSPRLVLVQGRATITEDPDRDYLERVIQPAATRFLGAPVRGRFWDRWLQEYYADRVPVEVAVERIVAWPDLEARGQAEVHGAPLPAEAPGTQAPPGRGTGPRIDALRAARRLRVLPKTLLGLRGADGHPWIVPVVVGGVDDRRGVRVIAAPDAIPPGARRAGLVAHEYRAKLIGLRTRQHTGWLEPDDDGWARYAPHTESGFVAPPNKTLLLLANGLMAKRGLRRARRGG